MIAPATRFGRLTVIEDLGHDSVRCRCDCGARCTLRRDAMRTAKSCGCMRGGRAGRTLFTKGASQ